MTAATTNLQVLLEGVKQFIIPLFQRPYTWGHKNEWKVLWEDIIDLYEQTDPKPHFIGSVVNMPQTSVPEGVAKYSVIDGQQRLTTLVILLLIIRDKHRQNRGEESLSEEIHETLLVNKFKQNQEYFKLLPTQKFEDRETFFGIVKSEHLINENQINKAYKFFDKKIRLYDNLDLNKLKNIITTNLSLVSITLDPNDNPYLVFESLNAKGTPLNPSDLIRNYLFMRVHIDLQMDLFKKYWDPMENSLGDNLTEYIRHFLMKDSSIVNKSDIYFTLKARVSNQNAEEYLALLHKFSKYYIKLLNPSLEPCKSISDKLKRLNRIEVTTSYPMLLNIYDAYKEERITSDDFLSILDSLENYLMRRFISGKPTRELNKIFPSVIRGIDDDYSNIVSRFKEMLASKGYPKDYEFEQRFYNMKFYGGADLLTKTRLILETVETNYGHKEQPLLDELTIEHVMPQTLTKSWQNELGENFNEAHEIYLHTIGNLTLTGYNPELSNRPFREKKEYFSNSNLGINKYFNNCEHWDKESIETRSKEIFSILNNIWSYFGPDNIVTDDEDKRGKTPTVLTISDEKFLVNSWRDVFEKTCEVLIEFEPDTMEIANDFMQYYYSSKVGSFNDYRQLSNGNYINVALSAAAIISVCQRLINKLGIPQEEWMVEF